MRKIDDAKKYSGGGYYCKGCGFRSDSQAVIFRHVATNHLNIWGKTFLELMGVYRIWSWIK